MPVHDWTRVRPGTFHHFHSAWITHLSEALNEGLLPGGYYALAEQPAEDVASDVLTLQTPDTDLSGSAFDDHQAGAIAVAEKPPQVSLTMTAELAFSVMQRRTLAIRHATGDRIVALLEILSPGNKHRRAALEAFRDKALAALLHGYHLLLVDLFPPGTLDPAGIHGVIWDEIEDDPYVAPEDKPLTLAAYEATRLPKAYVEPIAVGSTLPDMPLFLAPGWYVNVPLEATYLAAYHGFPERWRRVVEALVR